MMTKAQKIAALLALVEAAQNVTEALARDLADDVDRQNATPDECGPDFLMGSLLPVETAARQLSDILTGARAVHAIQTVTVQS